MIFQRRLLMHRANVYVDLQNSSLGSDKAHAIIGCNGQKLRIRKTLAARLTGTRRAVVYSKKLYIPFRPDQPFPIHPNSYSACHILGLTPRKQNVEVRTRFPSRPHRLHNNRHGRPLRPVSKHFLLSPPFKYQYSTTTDMN